MKLASYIIKCGPYSLLQTHRLEMNVPDFGFTSTLMVYYVKQWDCNDETKLRLQLGLKYSAKIFKDMWSGIIRQ